jgi:hippurate hydrolase
VAERTFGPESATRELPVVLAGEDFSFYLESIPGAFWFIGAGGESAPLHNAHYDFCDELLPKMVAMHVGCVMEARS